jgi:Tfp pilus assembly protein PilV
VKRYRAGLTLAETVIGLFLLTFGILVSIRLFDAGLQHQATVERRALATKLAEKSMAQLRAWVRTSIPPNSVSSSYNFDAASWAPAVPATDPDYPGFTVAVRTTNLTLYSPCSEFEQPYTGLGTARDMTRSARSVKIAVTDPTNSRFSVELVSWVADPSRHLDRVSMTNLSGSIPAEFEPAVDLANPAPGSWVEFEAKGHYADGGEVPDLMFDWYTVPLGGNGTVVPARDGRTARFINGVQMTNSSPPISTAGAVAFVVHGQYRGHGQPPQEWQVLVPNPFIAVQQPPFELK